MPKYRNDTSATVVRNGKEFLPGQEHSLPQYLPHETELTLVEHIAAGRTGKVLYDGALPGGTVTGLPSYDRIRVYNGTDADILVQPNEDGANKHRVPASAVLEIDNAGPRKYWYSLQITGSGSGNVQVVGE